MISRLDATARLCLVIGLITRVLNAVWNGGWFIDDTYIYWRYADNFAEGAGLVYNVGEWVLGFTSPLFMAVVAAVHWWLPSAAYSVAWICFGIACFFFSCLLLNRLLASRSGNVGRHLALILFALYFPFVDAAVQGMETPLFILLILLLLERAFNGRSSVQLGLAAAGVILTRPEGILFALPVFVYGWTKDARTVRRAALVALVPLSLWAGVASRLYGSPVPNSALAKASGTAGAIRSPADVGVYLMSLLGGLSDNFKNLLPDSILTAAAAALGILLLVLAVACIRARSPFQTVTGTALGLFLAFYFIGQPGRIFSWYGVPGLLMLLLWLASALPGRRWPMRAQVGVLLAVGFLVASISYLLADYRRGRMHQTVSQRYVAASRWIEENTSMDDVICISDIGYIGWRTRRPIADLGGLVSRHVAQAHARGAPVLRSVADAYGPPKLYIFKSWNGSSDEIVELFMRFRAFEDERDRAEFESCYSRLPSELESSMGSTVFVRSCATKSHAAQGASDF